MPTAKKYKLFAADGADGGVPPCAFFASPAGCRNGASCKFAHVRPTEAAVETGSVVSSESDDEPMPSPSVPIPTTNNKQKSAKTKAKTTQQASPQPQTKQAKKVQIQMDTAPTDDSPFRQSPPKPKKNRRSQKEEDLGPFANPKKKVKSDESPGGHKTAAQEPTPPPTTNSPKPKQQPAKTAVAGFDIRALNLPVASFTMPGTAPAPTAPPQPPAPVADAVSNVQEILPTHTTTGAKWMKAIQQARQHHKYATAYDFVKYKALDAEIGLDPSSVWIQAKPYGEWCKGFPQAIAIDCEMCETEDPVSGKHNAKDLCRVSIVNAENDEVLLDSLVKPSWPVVDYRSRINGITEEHLKGVQFTLRHTQAFLMALCSQETVILGHALHNDLAAMRMEHYCNADSANLFSASDSERSSVSLKDLASNVLKKTMPDKHDSVNDARTAWKVLEHWVEKDGQVEPIVRSMSVKQTFASQLFIHRIPKNMCEESHLSRMFLAHTSIAPTEVEEIEFAGEMGKTHVVFKSPQHANLAFDTLDSKTDTDPSGRLQKKVFLRNGGYIRVRKMAFEKPRDKSPPRRALTTSD
jgi:RNA exonuclease 1